MNREEFTVCLSESMNEWHRKNLTLPPEIVRQCNSIRNHGIVEGAT